MSNIKLKGLLSENVKIKANDARTLLIPVVKLMIKKGIITSNIYSVDYAPELTDAIIRLIPTIKD